MDDTQTKLKKYEQWLLTLKVLSVVCLVLGIIFTYRYIKCNGHPAGMAIFMLCALMFFLAYREKSTAPRPGSPEYEAIERAQASRIKASQERLYRKQHPFMVARELVANNKSIPSRAQQKTEPLKKDSAEDSVKTASEQKAD